MGVGSTSAQRLPSAAAEAPARIEIQVRRDRVPSIRANRRRSNLARWSSAADSNFRRRTSSSAACRASGWRTMARISSLSATRRTGSVAASSIAAMRQWGSPTPRLRRCFTADGRPITARGWYDSEALAEDGGVVYVALERVHRILKFDYGKRGLMARGDAGPRAAGNGQACQQPGHRMPDGRAEGLAGRRRADRDCGTKSR